MGIRRFVTLAAGVPLVLAGAAPALADNVVVNSVTATVVDVGQTSSVVYRLQATGQGADGQAGCNAADGTPARVTVHAPAGLTASPAGFEFNRCDNAGDSAVTFTAAAPGTYTVTLSVTDGGSNAGNGTYDTSRATVTLTVRDSNKAPTVAVTGVADGATYTVGAVPQPGCAAADDQPLTAEVRPEVTGGAHDAVGEHTVTCTYTDAGGLTARASARYLVALPPNTAPTVTVTGVVDGGEYPAAAAPAPGCDAADADEELADPTVVLSGPVNERGIGERTATCTVTDSRGSTATATAGYRLTNSAPTVAVTGVEEGAVVAKDALPTPGCTAADADEPLADPAPAVDRTGLNARGIGTVVVTCSVSDSDGGTASDRRSYSVANGLPTVAVTGVEDGGSYPAASAPTPGCEAGDPDEEVTAALAVDRSGLNPRGIGPVVASCEVEDSDGGAARDVRSYALTNTAPVVSVTGPKEPSYVNGTAPLDDAFGCEAVDADEADLAAPAPVVDRSALVRGLGTVRVTCSVEDSDGGRDTDATSYDVTNSAPSVAVTGVDEDGYEIGDEPATGCLVTDLEDDLAAEPVVDRSALRHGLGTVVVTCDVTDTDGAAAEQASARYEVVDTGDPTIAGAPTTQPNAAGWYAGDVQVGFTCADGGSGVASCGPDATVTGEGTDLSVSGTATDHAGNTASTTVGPFKVDRTGPVVTRTAGPEEGSSHPFGHVPAASCTATDALSGVAGSCVAGPVTQTLGAASYTLTATDVAGNTTTRTVRYTVVRWRTAGYHAPVDMGGTVNTVKAGSTVPLKFEAFAGDRELTSTADVASFRVLAASCATGAAADEIEAVTSGGTVLRYDATGGQFVQNWQTPKAPGGCYRAVTTLRDSTTIEALFKLR